MSGKNVISALESIISEYGNMEEIICNNWKQKVKNNPTVVTRVPYNSRAVLSRGRIMLDMMPMPRSYHPPTPAAVMATESTQCQLYGNHPQWYPHWVRTLQGHM